MVVNTGLEKIPVLLCQVSVVYTNHVKTISWLVCLLCTNTSPKGFHATKYYPNYLWIVLDVDNQGYVPPLTTTNCSASQITRAFNKTLLLTNIVWQHQHVLLSNVTINLLLLVCQNTTVHGMHSHLMDAVWVLAKALNSCNITNTRSAKSCDLIQKVATTKWKDEKVCTGF